MSVMRYKIQDTADQQEQSYRIHEVARLLRKYFEQKTRAKKLGLTRSQAGVLARLSVNEGINQASLAQLLELEPITLVRLLDRLQSAGLIERRADPGDRRARVLYLTDAAWPLIERIGALGKEVVDESMTGISEAERAVFYTTLNKMKANLLDRLAREPGDRQAAHEEHMEVING